jgi:von Willebrand factor type A domain/HYR domain
MTRRSGRARLLGQLGAVVALVLSASASAAPGVTPASVSLAANPGATLTVPKAVETPVVPPNPDIVFLVDTTTSMGPAIGNVQANLQTVLSTVLAAQPTAQFAVADYKDTADSGGFFFVRQGLTASTAAVQTAINNLSLSGGGTDAPEDWINALFQVSTGAISFRSNGTPIVVLVGDSSSHNPSNGILLTTAITALQAAGIKVVAIDVGPTPNQVSDGLNFFGQAAAVAAGTGGVLLFAPDPNTVAGQILAGLQNLPVTVTHAVGPCSPSLTVTVAPASQTVTSGQTASFTETILVAANAPQGQTVTCTVTFLLNGQSGGPAFVETISIKVNDITPPVVTVNDRTVEATSPAGAVINYVATAVDNVDGPLTPTCNPPSGSLFPIGSTLVTCTATDAAGNTGSDTAIMTVVDTTPPITRCVETTNPSGKNVPRARNTNPDGFFALFAVDIADVSPDIFIRDSADPSVEFGPFPSGTKIKLTQAPGATQSQKPGPGAIDWHIKLKGDALLVATDFSGNESDPISCLVPPPPK